MRGEDLMVDYAEDDLDNERLSNPTKSVVVNHPENVTHQAIQQACFESVGEQCLR